jgi:hypothetical protein
MTSPYTERRKHPRFNVQIPIDFGLIDLGGKKTAQAQFKGLTTDISMEGLGLELHYPAPEILFLAPKLAGNNKQFDLKFHINSVDTEVSGVGDIRWARIDSPSILKMGVFLKELGDSEKEKWTSFVMSQTKRIFRHGSPFRGYGKHTLPAFLLLTRDLIASPFSINYILPGLLLSSSAVVYWLVEVSVYHVLIPCGIATSVILLTKSRISSRKPKPRSEIPQWFLRKFCGRVTENFSNRPKNVESPKTDIWE